MLPDQGLYEERYRLTGSVAMSLVVSLGMFALAVHASEGVWLAMAVLAFVTVTVPALATAVGRKVAFRADPLGITLGAAPLSWPGRDSAPVFIPWSDVERIVLYGGGKSRELGARERQWIGIQRRPGAPRLPRGNGPARSCPVPGVAEGATRQVIAWRLDRERLTALTSAVAPGIPVIDASADAVGPAVEGTPVEGTPVEGTPVEGAAVEGPDPASWLRRRRSPFRIRRSGPSRRCRAPSCSSCRRSSSGGPRP